MATTPSSLYNNYNVLMQYGKANSTDFGYGTMDATPSAGSGEAVNWLKNNGYEDLWGDPSKYNSFAQSFVDNLKTQPGWENLEGISYENGVLKGVSGSGDNRMRRSIMMDENGTLGGSSWLSKPKESAGSLGAKFGLMALAAAGGLGLAGAGPLSGLAGEAGAGGLSGMDLAADAALGTGNNVMTAGAGLGGSGGLGSVLSGLPSTPSTGNKVVDNLIKNVISKSLGGGSGGVSTLGNILSGVSNGIGYNRTDNLIDEIKGIYKPDGEYSKYLENRLGRQDAAAGRNSQYGPRLAQLTGMLADSQSRALQGLGPMMQSQQGNLNGVLGAGGRLFDTFGGTDYLKNLFSGNNSGLSSEWALGANAGPQLPEGISDITDLLDWF